MMWYLLNSSFKSKPATLSGTNYQKRMAMLQSQVSGVSITHTKLTKILCDTNEFTFHALQLFLFSLYIT